MLHQVILLNQKEENFLLLLILLLTQKQNQVQIVMMKTLERVQNTVKEEKKLKES